MFLSLISLSLRSVFHPIETLGQQKAEADSISIVWPILFGGLTPCFFALSFLMMKHATLRYGLSSVQLSFNIQCAVQTFIIFVAVGFFSVTDSKIDLSQIPIGILAGLTDAIGKVSATYASVIGLAGVSSAICSLCGPWLVLIECIKTGHTLTSLELISLCLCLLGTSILMVPNTFLTTCQPQQSEHSSDEGVKRLLTPVVGVGRF